MKRIEFEGRTHEFPDDFSDAEIAAALSSAPTSRQIRAEPGAVRSTIREIAPLLGLLFGGAAGGGPTPLGVAGASLGYAGGKQAVRAGEAAYEALYPPPTGIKPTYGDLSKTASRIGEDIPAGAFYHLLPLPVLKALQSAGAGARSLMGLSSTPSRLAEAEIAKAAAARQDIEMTAGAKSGSPSVAMWEAFPTRFPVGEQTAEPTLERVRSSALEAVKKVGKSFGPSAELETAGQAIQQEVKGIASAQESAPTGLLDRFISSLSPKSLFQKGRITAGKTMQAGMEATEEAARSKASVAYNAALAANPGAEVTLSNTAAQSTPTADLERRLLGLAKPGLGSTARKVEKISEVTMTKDELLAAIARQGRLEGKTLSILESLPPGRAIPVKTLPLQFIEDYNLETVKSIPMSDALALQQRLNSLIRNSSDDYTKKRLRPLLQAVTDDIGAAGADFSAASQIYKREVAELFTEKGALRKILDAPPGEAAKRLLESKSPDELVAIMRGTPPGMRPDIRRLFMEKVKDRALDTQTGQVGPAKLEEVLHGYGEDNLRFVLGGKGYKELSALRQTLRANFGRESISPVLERMTTARPEQIANQLAVGQFKSSADFDAVWNVLTPETKQLTRSALYSRLLQGEGGQMTGAAIDPGTGKFSMDRFLRRLNDIPPNIRKQLWEGDAGAAIDDLITVFRQMNIFGRIAANPSQTAGAWLSAAQGLQLFSTIGDIGWTLASGGELKPRHFAEATLFFSPAIAGKAIYSKTGQRILSGAKPGKTEEPLSLLGRMLGVKLGSLGEED